MFFENNISSIRPTRGSSGSWRQEHPTRRRHWAALSLAAAVALPAAALRTQVAAAAGPDAPATGPAAGPAATQPSAADVELRRTAMEQNIRHGADLYQAQLKVEEARKAQSENRIGDAVAAYGQALKLDPQNEAARAGMNDLLQISDMGGTANTVKALGNDVNARQGLIRYRFDQALDKADAAIKADLFTDADAQINNAQVARDADPQIFEQTELDSFDARIKDAKFRLSQARAQKLQEDKLAANAQIQQTDDQQRQIAARDKRRTIADLIENSQQLIREAQYGQALDVLDQILTLQPTNVYARGIRPLVNDKFVLQQQRDYRDLFDREMEHQMNMTEEKKIPYGDIIRFPDDWPDISEIRDASVKAERGVTDVNVAVENQLNRRLPEIKFEGNGFGDVVDFLRDVTGANIFVNWRALEAAGINKEAPVNARLRDVKFSKALSTILDDVGGNTVKLAYTIDEGVITVSTADDLSKNTMTRTYDIRDLLVDVPDFTNAPNFSLTAAATGGSSGGGAGGGTGQQQNLFGQGAGGAGGGAGGGTTQTLPRAERVEAIIKLIEETVAPDSWRDAGGTVGAIRELAGSGTLIVTQTAENQQQLVSLLAQLRETRAIQICIETRFLIVQRNFLDDVGFDMNFYFNTAGSHDFSTIQVTQNGSAFTESPQGGIGVGASTGLPGSIAPQLTNSALSLGNAAIGAQPAAGANALTPGTAASFGGPGGVGIDTNILDGFHADFLLQATQAQVGQALVDAPRLTLFNGQRAWIVVAVQQAYVSNLTPQVAFEAAAFQPTISVVSSGVLLDVQATVSADRKYVTLTLRPQLATLLGFFSFAFEVGTQATVPAGTANVGTTNAGTVANGSSTGEGVIEQPELALTEIRTTVSVPDGGTLLIGGETLAGETTQEAGVPVMSKIPFVNRLFTNRSTAKDEKVLLILVKPTIIIQREQEQKQFPLLTHAEGI